MGDKSKIEWTDATWSPVTGCSHSGSPGCDNCYAKRMAKRLQAMGQENYRNGFEVTEHPHMLNRPLHWKRPRKIFVVSMGDLFHRKVRNEFIAAVFGVMAACPHHKFQLLTKHPRRAKEWFDWVEQREQDGRSMFPHDEPSWRIYQMLSSYALKHGASIPSHHGGKWPLPNVWMGTTTENQPAANERIPMLLQIPAAIHFISVEPMLSAIDVSKWLPRLAKMGYASKEITEEHGVKAGDDFILKIKPCVSWVLCGGESGPNARPMNPDWARSLRDQCKKSEISFFLKQMAKKTTIPADLDIKEFPGDIKVNGIQEKKES